MRPAKPLNNSYQKTVTERNENVVERNCSNINNNIETKHCLITTQPANTRNLLTMQVYHIAESRLGLEMTVLFSIILHK